MPQKWFERRVVDVLRLVVARARSVMLSARGARLGEKVRLGPRISVHRPWSVHLGDRCVLEAEVFLKVVDDAAVLIVGSDSFVGRGTEFDVLQSVTVGRHTLIAPGCFITDHGHRFGAESRIDSQGCSALPVVIGSDVWIGTQSIILQGARVGDGAVIGAHSVVKGEIPAMAIAVGAPARIVGKRQGNSEQPISFQGMPR